MTEPTYNAPPHGWTCFHCGETFKTVGAARDHFGFEPSADPGCRIKVGQERGLLMALRRAENELARAWGIIHNESSDAINALRNAGERLHKAVIDAEENGYAKGLADARKESIEISE